jgi:hypothetical protein
VTVDYKTTGSVPAAELDVYRSATSTVDPAATTVPGTQTFLGEESLSSLTGSGEVTILKGHDLPPDPAKPYVVVVAKYKGKTSQTYFRKWRLATIAHGYAGLSTGDQANTLTWVRNMASALKENLDCDEAIPFDWIAESVAAQTNMTVQAGNLLANRIQLYRAQRASEHLGDVVDILMVGHSRGTVVTSQALLLLAKHPSGGIIDVVLLDCHPANWHSNDLCSPRLGDNTNIISKAAYDRVTAFQIVADDPEIVIPADAEIHSVKVWWQKTPSNAFHVLDPNHILNLWGIGLGDGRIQNLSGVIMMPFDLTGKPFDQPEKGDSVGHEQVHEWYEDLIESRQFQKP